MLNNQIFAIRQESMGYPIVVGNWKMNLGLSEGLILASQVARQVEKINHLEVVLCPPSPFVFEIFQHLRAKPRNLHFGLQNIMWEQEGAYTGEVSADMVKGICRYFIIGHSERRKIFAETDEMVNKKTNLVLHTKMTPIVCVGESERFDLENRYKYEIDRMSQANGILFQIDKALEGISKVDLPRVVLAYEPVWAIGTGNAADGAYVAAICYIIKSHLEKKYSEDIAREIKVLYGGSVLSRDAREYMLQPSIEGLLVGGASLKAAEFIKICKITSEVKSGKLI